MSQISADSGRADEHVLPFVLPKPCGDWSGSYKFKEDYPPHLTKVVGKLVTMNTSLGYCRYKFKCEQLKAENGVGFSAPAYFKPDTLTRAKQDWTESLSPNFLAWQAKITEYEKAVEMIRTFLGTMNLLSGDADLKKSVERLINDCDSRFSILVSSKLEAMRATILAKLAEGKAPNMEIDEGPPLVAPQATPAKGPIPKAGEPHYAEPLPKHDGWVAGRGRGRFPKQFPQRGGGGGGRGYSSRPPQKRRDRPPSGTSDPDWNRGAPIFAILIK